MHVRHIECDTLCTDNIILNKVTSITSRLYQHHASLKDSSVHPNRLVNLFANPNSRNPSILE